MVFMSTTILTQYILFIMYFTSVNDDITIVDFIQIFKPNQLCCIMGWLSLDVYSYTHAYM